MRALFGFFCDWIAQKYNIPYIYVEWSFLTFIYGVYIFARPGRLQLDNFDIIVYFGLIFFNLIIYFLIALFSRDMETFYELFRREK